MFSIVHAQKTGTGLKLTLLMAKRGTHQEISVLGYLPSLIQSPPKPVPWLPHSEEIPGANMGYGWKGECKHNLFTVKDAL